MTDDERFAIEWACTRLVHRYANLNDAGDWDAVAELYAPDGQMARPTAPDQAIEGRAAILAAFRARPPRTTRHVCANVVIDVADSDTASGESVMLLFTGPGAPIVGMFHDTFVRSSGEWRFASRRGSVTFMP